MWGEAVFPPRNRQRGHPGRRHVPAVAAAVGCLLVALGAPASAHAGLVGSQPAPGVTVEAAPADVTLVFGERIEPDFAQVRVLGPDGEAVDAGEPVVEGTRVRLPLDLGEQPASGTYQVTFRVMTADGHSIESAFPFNLALSTSPAATAPAHTSVAPDAQPAGFRGTAAAALRIARFANYLAFTVVVGLLLGVAWLLADRGRILRYADRRVLRIGGWVAVAWAGTAVAMFVLGLADAAARPIAEVMRSGALARFAGSRFGGAVLAQAAVAVLVAVLAWRVRARPGTWLALAVAALGGLAPAWWGHAGTSPTSMLAVVSAWAHGLAAAVWVGGLMAVVLLVLKPGSPDPLRSARRFSRLAGWALGVILATGLQNSLAHLGSLPNLIETSWGRLVLVKIALLTVVGWLGWVNRHRSLPLLAAGGGVTARRRFRRVALAEVGVMLVAFGTASRLASSAPAELEAEAAARTRPVATTLDNSSGAS
ncbi:MAG: copper resistance CopC/CopD family protein [Egibacteraceae bacterium]